MPTSRGINRYFVCSFVTLNGFEPGVHTSFSMWNCADAFQAKTVCWIDLNPKWHCMLHVTIVSLFASIAAIVCPYCWLPVEKVPAVSVVVISAHPWLNQPRGCVSIFYSVNKIRQKLFKQVFRSIQAIPIRGFMTFRLTCANLPNISAKLKKLWMPNGHPS